MLLIPRHGLTLIQHGQNLLTFNSISPRNLKLGLALDGVNPLGNQSTSWSMWPMFVLNYNLPPWLPIKFFFLMFVLLIARKKLVKNNNIDIYMAPLVKELQELWKGWMFGM
jgi:hypothetical protein